MMLYNKAEEFIKDEYWKNTHNKNCNFNLEEVIKNRLAKDNRDKDPEYYGHREGTVHVSSLSKCLRGVVYEMLGADKDAKDEDELSRKYGIFKAGNLFEDFVVDAIGDKMQDRQTEYIFKYKSIILTGRDDGTILHEGESFLLEAKSVHSDSFWYRQKEGTLVAHHNQMQIQTYLWLRRILPNLFVWVNEEGEILRAYTNLSVLEFAKEKGLKSEQIAEKQKPNNENLNGVFSYISKDDCTVIGAPVKFNKNIIDETIIPALDLISEAYEKKDPTICPCPDMVAYSESRGQWQKNWMCTYCDYHSKCAGESWLLEATKLVTRKNKEMKESAFGNLTHTEKKTKPTITVEN